MKPVTPLVTELMGTKLRSPKGEEIGVVQNMMVNPSEGTIIFIFLCYANFIGKVHRHFAIPREHLHFKQDGHARYFEIDEQQLMNIIQCYDTTGTEYLHTEYMYQPRLAV
ncbi:PRC-barrel domain-containing protein [Fodinibius salsisoli]|uniref:PRC-barrel domain-containing protein n=1 Tax=Fodinibius salsisoli TaxID=2820877 RepID=A0ABT3PSG5_9BACT|nr:PRC-barrel domain-containing protein [Fodinibius salsisoli]MCW9708796.1 PRC-barrel domain-containing protein [Fodinibius salsisoli]